MRNVNDNFVTEFLKYSDEYNVHPLPKIVVSFLPAFLRVFQSNEIYFLTFDYRNRQSHVDLRVSSTQSMVSDK